MSSKSMMDLKKVSLAERLLKMIHENLDLQIMEELEVFDAKARQVVLTKLE